MQPEISNLKFSTCTYPRRCGDLQLVDESLNGLQIWRAFLVKQLQNNLEHKIVHKNI